MCQFYLISLSYYSPGSQLDSTLVAFNEPHPSSVDVERLSTNSLTPQVSLAGPSGILNTRSDYYTIPTVNELDSMATGNLFDPIEVDDFTVGRHGYGVIVFLGSTNVCGLNLDKLGKSVDMTTS